MVNSTTELDNLALPDGSGFEVCSRLREGAPGRAWNRDVRVIMVAERSEPVDRLRGFARGPVVLSGVPKGGGNGQTVASSHDSVFWKYMVAPPPVIPNTALGNMPAAKVLFEDAELRVLSKATNAAGGYLVPSDFDAMVSTAHRARAVIPNLAREIEVDHGRLIPLPTATAHGAASWVAENAAVTPTDEKFGQVSVNAYRASTQVIVSEELAQDALPDFDAYLADELGQRIALLEETAFAVGDGTGKPLGITTSGNGVSVVTAATGSTTSFKLVDIRAVYDALPVAYRPSASWLMSPSASPRWPASSRERTLSRLRRHPSRLRRQACSRPRRPAPS